MEAGLAPPLVIFCQAVLLGACGGLVYDLLRAVRGRLPWLTPPLDFAYCAAAASAVFFFTLRQGQGQLRIYVMLGICGGAWLFFAALSRPLRPVWDFWVDTAALLLRLAAVPLRGGKNLCKKIWELGKKLFYFIWKCYTIKHNSQKPRPHRGGRQHGKMV